MSKEYLEAFGLIKRTCEIYMETTRFLKGSDIIANQIKEALNTIQNRLESIGNSNPSEALKLFEEFKDILLQNVVFLDTDLQRLNTIKQALIKAQEPKHYLKWEDLEFTNEEQSIQVLLNGKKYTMFYCSDEVCFDTVSIAGVFIDCCDKQFFNDLHLERVEE